MAIARVAFRRDTASRWNAANPVLADGEPGYDTTNLQIRIGDGINQWSDLAVYKVGYDPAQQGPPGVGVPNGGTTGQVLKKVSGTDYDTAWQADNTSAGGGSLPTGGTAGQVLKKNSGTDGDAGWATDATGSGVPTGGTAGQFLKKNSSTDGDAIWITVAPGAAGGFGPNWVAASNTPTSIKNAITAAGGLACDGTNDHAEINTQMATFGDTFLAEGDFNLGGTIAPSARRRLSGSGPRTRLIGKSGLSGAFITLAYDHNWIRDLLMIADTEAAATDHILANITSKTGFITGSDACIILTDIISQNAKGRGVVMTGDYNRDSKLSKLHIHNPVSHGMYINCPDGSFEQVVVGTAGGNGIWMDGASNWRGVNSKCWYSDLDGFLINGIRSQYTGIEGQDNLGAGIRIIGNNITLNSWTADSNSYDGSSPSAPTGVNYHAGLEIGRPYHATGSPSSNSGGYDISVGPGQSWDKNEKFSDALGPRGYRQSYGVRIRSSVGGLTMVGVQTGDSGGTHHNVSGGIKFDTTANLTSSSVFVSASLNDHARMSSI